MTRFRKLALSAFAALAVLAAAEGFFRLYWRWNGPPASSAEEVFELYAIGGSTVLGMPYPEEIAFPVLVAEMFDRRLAGRRIVVRNLAVLGDSIYPQALRLRLALKYRDRNNPAAVLIYSGHNEALAQPGRPSPAAWRLYQAIKERLLYRTLLLGETLARLERGLGLRGPRDLRACRFYFEKALQESLAAGAFPVPATVIGNVSGMEPQLSPRTGETRDEDASLMATGLTLEGQSRHREAMAYYRGLLGRRPSLSPLLRYRLGKCHEALKEYAAAKRLFWEAIDEDSQSPYGRATSRENDMIRGLASDYGLPLVDTVKLFEKRSPHGLVGNELFVDIHHPNMAGTLILARGFAAALSSRFGEPVRRELSAEQAYALARDGKPRPAHDYMWSGNWSAAFSFAQPAPMESLRFAKASFRRALRLMPDHYWSWVGLGLVEIAGGRAPTERDEEAGWILDILFHPRACIPAATGEKIAAAFKRLGVPETILSNMTRLGRDPRHSQFCR